MPLLLIRSGPSPRARRPAAVPRPPGPFLGGSGAGAGVEAGLGHQGIGGASTTTAPTTTVPPTTTTTVPPTTHRIPPTTVPTTVPVPAVSPPTTAAAALAASGPVHYGQVTFYDHPAGTCASPYLPFGTEVQVTNPANGASVTCLVNDREADTSRSIDLATATFAEIAPLSQGVIDAQLVW